jgi:hypothetical protein
MRCRFKLLLVFACFVPACSNTTTTPTPPPIDLGEGLKELGEVYKYRATHRMPAPAKLDDLTEQEAAIPNAWQPIQEGQIVVVWKVSYSANATDVLAYVKDAATVGGKVLLRNGTVKQMTADEFRAAKK